MAFLTSTGSTTSEREYIIDLIRLHFRIIPNSIPNQREMGINTRLDDIDQSEVENELRRRIERSLAIINSRHGFTLTFNRVSREAGTGRIIVEINYIQENLIFRI